MSNARNASKLGNAPAFSVTKSATQSVSGTTFTKVTFDTKQVDTATAFDTSTSRFQPQVAGWYQISVIIYNSGSVTGQALIYKTGSAEKYGPYVAGTGQHVSSLVYLNGSTDYVEAYVYYALAGTVATSTHFQGFLAKPT